MKSNTEWCKYRTSLILGGNKKTKKLINKIGSQLFKQKMKQHSVTTVHMI